MPRRWSVLNSFNATATGDQRASCQMQRKPCLSLRSDLSAQPLAACWPCPRPASGRQGGPNPHLPLLQALPTEASWAWLTPRRSASRSGHPTSARGRQRCCAQAVVRCSECLAPPCCRKRGDGIDGLYDPVWGDVMNHVRTTRQDVEPTACELAVQPLCLPIAHDPICIACKDGRGRKQRTIARAHGARS